MSPLDFLLLLACVAGIAIGQVLFKVTANQAQNLSSPIDVLFVPSLFAALLIYGVATITWIWLLRHVPLSKAYPLMALSFVLVPLMSVVFLEESVSPRFWIGVALTVGGVLLCNQSS